MKSVGNSFSVMVAGIGGQGVVLLAKAIAAAACESHAFVCRTETRGLSQRGGLICAEIRFGNAPVVPAPGLGSEDLILSLDLLEALRVLSFLKPDGCLLSADRLIPPAYLVDQWKGRPGLDEEDLLRVRLTASLQAQPQACLLRLDQPVREAGCSKALNIVMLGAACAWLPWPWQTLRVAALAAIKPEHREANERAFDLGRRVALCADLRSGAHISPVRSEGTVTRGAEQSGRMAVEGTA